MIKNNVYIILQSARTSSGHQYQNTWPAEKERQNCNGMNNVYKKATGHFSDSTGVETLSAFFQCSFKIFVWVLWSLSTTWLSRFGRVLAVGRKKVAGKKNIHRKYAVAVSTVRSPKFVCNGIEALCQAACPFVMKKHVERILSKTWEIFLRQISVEWYFRSPLCIL